MGSNFSLNSRRQYPKSPTSAALVEVQPYIAEIGDTPENYEKLQEENDVAGNRLDFSGDFFSRIALKQAVLFILSPVPTLMWTCIPLVDPQLGFWENWTFLVSTLIWSVLPGVIFSIWVPFLLAEKLTMTRYYLHVDQMLIVMQNSCCDCIFLPRLQHLIGTHSL